MTQLLEIVDITGQRTHSKVNNSSDEISTNIPVDDKAENQTTDKFFDQTAQSSYLDRYIGFSITEQAMDVSELSGTFKHPNIEIGIKRLVDELNNLSDSQDYDDIVLIIVNYILSSIKMNSKNPNIIQDILKKSN